MKQVWCVFYYQRANGSRSEGPFSRQKNNPVLLKIAARGSVYLANPDGVVLI